MTKKGFTILELLITLSIIIILSGALLIGWRKGEDVYTLQRAAYKLERDIKEAQTRTMEADEMDCVATATSSASFGVFLDTSLGKESEYILFLDCNNDHVWDGGSTDLLIEQIEIEEGVEIFSLNAGAFNNLHIVFVPPEPITYINTNDSGFEAIIDLSLKEDFNKKRTVKVNTSGRIEIN